MPPFAYYLSIAPRVSYINALLKVAKVLGIELRKFKQGESPGSSAYVIIPPKIYLKVFPQLINSHSLAISDAIAARILLRIPNQFLYYGFSSSEEPEEEKHYGLTIFSNICFFIRACTSNPRYLEEYEVKNITQMGCVKKARYLIHEFKKNPKSNDLIREAIDCIREAVENGILAQKEHLNIEKSISFYKIKAKLEKIIDKGGK